MWKGVAMPNTGMMTVSYFLSIKIFISLISFSRGIWDTFLYDTFDFLALKGEHYERRVFTSMLLAFTSTDIQIQHDIIHFISFNKWPRVNLVLTPYIHNLVKKGRRSSPYFWICCPPFCSVRRRLASSFTWLASSFWWARLFSSAVISFWPIRWQRMWAHVHNR